MTTTQTKEHPIPFNGPMIRAILEGRKTQTRRVIKPQPSFTENAAWLKGDGHSGKGWYCADEEYAEEGSLFYRCPYGQPGDRLWVQETFANFSIGESGPMIAYKADGWKGAPSWKPSINMPREASRITLEVVAVRVERLQEISEEDAKAEGVGHGDLKCGAPVGSVLSSSHYRYWFGDLWDSINTKRGHGWDKNDWVWVIKWPKFRSP